ncbi:MAG: NYN domain-containing protein [Negativicutes bacterium]|nr:NYN domain-containing protein [Negativicutes bacterium]
MNRTMIFIDYQNFEWAFNNYYRQNFPPAVKPGLDYSCFPFRLSEKIPGSWLVRTYVFIARPDEFLMQDERLRRKYQWLTELPNYGFIKVIEGRLVARPSSDEREMDISDWTSFYKEEKGTDVNLSIEMVSKAYLNAYDCAILVSGDTDQIPAVELVTRLGKNLVVAGVEGQNLQKLSQCADACYYLDHDFFQTCMRH